MPICTVTSIMHNGTAQPYDSSRSVYQGLWMSLNNTMLTLRNCEVMVDLRPTWQISFVLRKLRVFLAMIAVLVHFHSSYRLTFWLIPGQAGYRNWLNQAMIITCKNESCFLLSPIAKRFSASLFGTSICDDLLPTSRLTSTRTSSNLSKQSDAA